MKLSSVALNGGPPRWKERHSARHTHVQESLFEGTARVAPLWATVAALLRTAEWRGSQVTEGVVQGKSKGTLLVHASGAQCFLYAEGRP